MKTNIDIVFGDNGSGLSIEEMNRRHPELAKAPDNAFDRRAEREPLNGGRIKRLKSDSPHLGLHAISIKLLTGFLGFWGAP